MSYSVEAADGGSLSCDSGSMRYMLSIIWSGWDIVVSELEEGTAEGSAVLLD